MGATAVLNEELAHVTLKKQWCIPSSRSSVPILESYQQDTIFVLFLEMMVDKVVSLQPQ